MRVLLAAVALLVPLAAAQVPAPGVQGGQVEATWAWTPAAFAADQGSVVDLRATAQLTLRGAVCAQPATVQAQATLAPQPESVGLKSDPLAITAAATAPPGAYVDPLGPPFQATVEVPFRFLVDLDAAPGAYTMLATTTTAAPEGCAAAGAGDGPATTSTQGPAFTVTVRRTETQLAAHPPHEEHGPGSFDMMLEPAAARSFQFNATGRYSYHDHFRPELRGTVVVQEQGPGSAAVQVTAQGFNPAEVEVKVGANVTWTNADRVSHTVSADELHPEHGARADDAETSGGGEGGGNATGPGGNGTALPDSTPPRGSPGLEPLGLGAGLAGAGLLAGRARRRDP